MRIHSPSFSGSISQANSAYAALSGSFTGSFTGSYKGILEDISDANIQNLTVVQTLSVGTNTANIQKITGSVFISGSVTVDGNVNTINGGQLQVAGVNVLDSAIAFAIALG